MLRMIMLLAMMAIGCGREKPTEIVVAPAIPNIPPRDTTIDATRLKVAKDRYLVMLRYASESVDDAASAQFRQGFTIEKSRPSRWNPDRIAFLVRSKGGSLSTYIFDFKGDTVSKPIDEDWFGWETEPPETMAELWSARIDVDSGTFQTESITECKYDPAYMDAFVIQIQRGKRYRFRLLSYKPGAGVNITLDHIDEKGNVIPQRFSGINMQNLRKKAMEAARPAATRP